MRQQLRNRGITFTSLRKFRPVGADLFIVRQQPALNADRNGDSGDAFGRGEN